jgi:hypothetical protein
MQNESARAQPTSDITFTQIPVNIQGLTSLTGPGDYVDIECETRDAANLALTSQVKVWPPHIVLDASGNFSGVVATEGINFVNPDDFYKAKTYFCRLTGKKATMGDLHYLEIGNGSQWWHAKSGTVLTLGYPSHNYIGVSGPIP